ncbi:MAG: helix-turn-helix transcriptional regulator [Lachnospiraceae bacterium]|nr:helix-turn-helix transcriptional regulator [Lachnospiraceae bacterium]
MREEIIRQYLRMPGADYNSADGRVTIPLPSDAEGTDGRIITWFYRDLLMVNLIDIRSQTIPGLVEDPIGQTRELKINYCAAGRCELKLKNGECTYLTAGEISVDAGQALNTYYYPNASYQGYEIVIPIPDEGTSFSLMEERFLIPDLLYKQCYSVEKPWIRSAGKFLSDFYDDFFYYAGNRFGSELIFIKCLELVTYLSNLDFSEVQLKRTYYTASQVEIAKSAKEILTRDLSRRYTAKELAERFGVSETALKNYFRSVYGTGYAEYQQIKRMELSARLLRETDDKIADIAMTVGYATQPKFGAAFKACYGVTPLEYRRQNRLKELKEGR